MFRLRLAYDACVFSGSCWLMGWRVISCHPASDVSSVPVKTETKRITQPRLVLLAVDEFEAGPVDPRAILARYLATLPEEEKRARVPMMRLAAEIAAL